jgi:membrane associated rhomboid family serine protease
MYALASPHYRRDVRWLHGLIAAYVVVFVTTKIENVWFGSFAIERTLSLSAPAVRNKYIWTPLSYAFLHGSCWHLFFNGLGLFFFGTFLLRFEFSLKTFFVLYIGGIVCGAALWLSINWHAYSVLMGASAGIMALVSYFCLAYPDRSLTILLFFFLPITLRARWMGYILWFYEIMHCLSQEIPHLSNVANSAHLGGMVAGWLCFNFNAWIENRPKGSEKEFKGRYVVRTWNAENDD